MARWAAPEQLNLDTGERQTLIKRVVVCDGMAKTAWLEPEENAKVATTGNQMIPEESLA